MDKAEEHFNENAEKYESLIEKIVTRHEIFFSQVVSLVPGGDIRVLELGSGTGYLTEKIIEKNPGAKVTCIDMTPEMIGIAMRKETLKNVEFIEGDFRNVWPNGKFDLVISTLCFHHLPDKDREEVTKMIRDSLADGGIFVNGDVFKSDDEFIGGILDERWKEAMIENGLSEKQADGMIEKRGRALEFIDTPEGYRKKLLDAGFGKVFCFYSFDIYGVFAAFR